MPKRRNHKTSGYFGTFGGQFVPEVLVEALRELEINYHRAKRTSKFKNQLKELLNTYAGRPTPLYRAPNLSKALGVETWLKREDLLHTGAHKINNTLGQALLTRWMKKKRIVAETGAGQHGVAVATVAALFKIPCYVYMGKKDVRRQALNVFRMKLLGANVVPVTSGSQTLKDATNEAIRDWITNVRDTHFILGSVVGPHPYPVIVRDLQSVIGRETLRQLGSKKTSCVVACVGGGSNAIGMFYPFLRTKAVLIGVEASGEGVHTTRHAASITKGTPGVLHGSKTYVLQDRYGQIQEAHSISAGLDYPGVGPEHAALHDSKRVNYVTASDKDALRGFQFLSHEEGIIPALEPAHAIGYLLRSKSKLKKYRRLIFCLSGRGDKDVQHVARAIHL